MAREIVIQAGSVTMEAELNDTKAADAIWEALPIEGRGNRWGEEIYFSIPVHCPPNNPREVVEVGDLAYWPPGSAFCIFFGPTPASTGSAPRAASAVMPRNSAKFVPAKRRRLPGRSSLWPR